MGPLDPPYLSGDARVWRNLMGMDLLRASAGGVFVCGSPHTEVSTVAWALAQHRAFWTSSESRFLYKLFGSRAGLERPYLYEAYCQCLDGGAWLKVNGVSYDEFLQALGTGIAGLFQSRAGDRRWVEGSPENALLGEDLLRMFPNACVIGLMQSARTAAFIAHRHEAAAVGGPGADDIAALNNLYAERLASMSRFAPARVFILEEDVLFNHPEAAFAALLDFLGEKNHPVVTQAFATWLHRLDMRLTAALQALEAFSPTARRNLTRRAAVPQVERNPQRSHVSNLHN
jgi:sulfotransferase family protein